MKASHEQIVRENDGPGAGHNVGSVEKVIQQFFTELSDIDKQRKVFNDRAMEIRETLKGQGIDPKAFMDQYHRAKKATKPQKEGYDESAKICLDALNKMDQADLFEWMATPLAEATDEPKRKPGRPKKDKPGITGEELAAHVEGDPNFTSGPVGNA